jgi:hypothetical protein
MTSTANPEARAAFADRRLGCCTHDDTEHARMTDAAVHSAPIGGIDFEAEWVRLRRLMAASLTPKRTVS